MGTSNKSPHSPTLKNIMAKTRTYILISCLLFGTAYSTCTESGRWGDNCDNVCSPGCQEALCDGTSGICSKPGCLRGWSGLQCNAAECERSHCQDLGGSCIAPDICQCPSQEANIVASVQEDEGNVNGYGVIVSCDNLMACATADKMINNGKVRFA